MTTTITGKFCRKVYFCVCLLLVRTEFCYALTISLSIILITCPSFRSVIYNLFFQMVAICRWFCQSFNKNRRSFVLLALTQGYFLNCLGAIWSCLLAVIRICLVFALSSLSPPLMDISKYWSVTKITSVDWHLAITFSTNSEMVPNV